MTPEYHAANIGAGEPGYLLQRAVEGAEMPLFGNDSIIGRSLVIFKNITVDSNPGIGYEPVTTFHPYLCAEIVPAAPRVVRNGSFASDDRIKGYLQMSQDAADPASETTIYVHIEYYDPFGADHPRRTATRGTYRRGAARSGTGRTSTRTM